MQNSGAGKITSRLFCLVDENAKAPLKHYSYFLIHPEGNVLFHALKKASLLKRHEALFAAHGGIKLQLLTHDAEASAACEWIHQRFGAGLYVHASDAPTAAHRTRCPIAHAFSSGHRVFDDLEAIPLSGHTLGFTAYRLSTSKATFLFSGDFLFPANDEWRARVHKLLTPVGIANLNALKDIAFSAILPNASRGPAAPPFKLTAAERVEAIEGAIAGVARTAKARNRKSVGRA